MKGLRDKVAVVTGGSSGIGQAIAIRLAEEGVNVAINYVGRPEGAEETRDAIEHGVQICMKQMSAAGYPFHDPLYSLLFASGDFLPEVRLTPSGVIEVKSRTVLADTVRP